MCGDQEHDAAIKTFYMAIPRIQRASMGKPRRVVALEKSLGGKRFQVSR